MEQVPHNPYHAMTENYAKVAEYIAAAAREVAGEFDDEDLQTQVNNQIAESDGLSPNVAALVLLDKKHPGTAERIMNLAEELQSKDNAREMAEQSKRTRRQIGCSLLRGIGSILDISGRSYRR
jgi:hypothetical protein